MIDRGKTFLAYETTVIEKYIVETFGVTRVTAKRHIRAAYNCAPLNSRKFMVCYWDGKDGKPDTITVYAR